MANPLSIVNAALAIGSGFVTFKPTRGFYPPQTGMAPPGQAQWPLPTIIAQITEREQHFDELEITDHPVEQGANITDHAFKKPAEVVIRCAWSNSPTGPGMLIGAAVGAATTFFPAAAGALNAIAGALNAIAGTVSAAQSVLGGSSPQQITNIYAQLLNLQSARVPFDVYTGKRQYTNMLFKSITVETDKEKENSLWVVVHCRQIIIVSTQVISSTPINPQAQAAPQLTNPTQNLGVQQLTDAPTFTDTPVSSLLSGAVGQLPLPNVQSAFNIGLGAATSSLSGAASALGNAASSVASGVTNGITNVWNDANQSWVTNITDSLGNKLVSGIPMVTGSNLIGQLSYLNIGGGPGNGLFAQTDHDIDAVPTFANLGTNGGLFFKAASAVAGVSP